jgi:hypothetical protein
MLHASRQGVKRAGHAVAPLLNACVWIIVVLTSLVSQRLLDRPNIVAGSQQLCRERRSKRVAACALDQAGAIDGHLDRTLHDRLVQVMPTALAGAGVEV